MRKRKVITGIMTAMAMLVSVTVGENPVCGEMLETKEATITGADAVKIASIHNPITDASTGAVTFSYVYFGSYPQSEVTGDGLTAEIIEADYADSGVVSEMTSFKGINNYAISGEAVVMDEKYRRMVREDGNYRYFKYEPIEWRVMKVTSGQAVMMTEKIVDWQIYGKSTGGNKWTGSHICNWLNGYEGEDNGFYPIAFEKKEAVISFNEGDNVSIFSFSELRDYYLFKYRHREENALIAMNSDYARFVSRMDSKAGYWMLNNAHSNIGLISYVDRKGKSHTSYKGVGLSDENTGWLASLDTNIGVRPAITLDLTKTELWEYAGEKSIQLELWESEIPAETPTATPLPSETTQPAISEEPSMRPSEEPVIILLGDIDDNGIVELSDAQLALKVALKIESLTNEEVVRGDVDKDEVITLGDAQTILKIALKIIL